MVHLTFECEIDIGAFCTRGGGNDHRLSIPPERVIQLRKDLHVEARVCDGTTVRAFVIKGECHVISLMKVPQAPSPHGTSANL